jgi:ribosomal protein S18 acetylase RimI-like enzyme
LIFTTPGGRSRGAGSALLGQCEQFLLTKALPEYLVRTVDHESNRALAFYLKNGFFPLGQSFEQGRTFRVFKKNVRRPGTP